MTGGGGRSHCWLDTGPSVEASAQVDGQGQGVSVGSPRHLQNTVWPYLEEEALVQVTG